ncbi:MAG: hypothetical protein EON56_02710 [Alphaproteobacteria bacterium]|nr:MAG: hypothetical protein EON56_02710 [Alphaproteobacteria bacterium]
MHRDQHTITAYHEAGHAVMAMANSSRVLEISNVASTVGRCFVRWASPDPISDDARWRSLLVLGAGMAAEFIHWNLHGRSDEASVGHFDDQLRRADTLWR